MEPVTSYARNSWKMVEGDGFGSIENMKTRGPADVRAVPRVHILFSLSYSLLIAKSMSLVTMNTSVRTQRA